MTSQEYNMLTYYMPLTTSSFGETEQKLMNFVSEERKAAIDRVRFDDSKLLTLYSALLARFSICEMTGIDNSDLNFSRTDHGKPFLPDIASIDFNISHTKGMILCSVTDTGKVGVDVEIVRPLKYNIMKRCFHPEEINYVESFNDDKHFFEIWTKKEAYTKYLGTGLAFDITSVNMLAKEHYNKLTCFCENDYIFSVYSDCKDKVLPVSVSTESMISHFSDSR